MTDTKLRILLVCNAYPSDGNLYRNGFIHRRVKAYQEEGFLIDVFYNHQPVERPYGYIFDGVPVTVGNDSALEEKLTAEDHDVYLVHFAEPSRIYPFERADIRKPIIVWIHGFEAESWYRRWFNFIQSVDSVSTALEKKEEYYKSQNSFFRWLATTKTLDVSFVNVSSWFQQFVVEPDIGVALEESETIHNLIDTDLFQFRRKLVSDRTKILLIRPFASYKYANDQAIEAIEILSNRPYFDALTFTVCGEGRYFNETVAPIKRFKNVDLVNRFLKQEEIVKYHQRHGIFLAPTRFDSQGVSMCEAMSSGLVPVSTNIAAIPEFVEDGVSGMLGAPEDATALADAIERLYFDDEEFLRISEAASDTISRKCGPENTVQREISLIKRRAGIA
ncbi:glycosyltransferase family 4 protein [Corynebacterium casei]|uniref:glycosyltransferase family 4 protein n=1 Tax=Corynebacterium casei TaxID=160386 RepID=UPI003FD59035